MRIRVFVIDNESVFPHGFASDFKFDSIKLAKQVFAVTLGMSEATMQEIPYWIYFEFF